MEALRLFLTQFTDETITITLLVLVLFCAILIGYWIYNRRKFQELTHQIPASVVKNYLDTIIQNSTALKSSLFRGGGLEIGEGIPSVLPVGQLPQGNVSVSVSNEEMNQKNAEIALLKRKITEKDKTIEELENLLAEAKAAGGSDSDASEEIGKLKSEVQDLKAQLKQASIDLAAAQAVGGSGGDEALKGQLDEVTKERDELKDRLTEYEIIEDELANLKRLQQENEQLKKTIAELQGEAKSATKEAAPEPEANPDPADESGDDLMAQMAAAMGGDAPAAEASPAEEGGGDEELGVPANQGKQKSAEELLSEFEKMLG
ncbi:MAG: hypothetical protein Fur0010_02970 [Bdellovibrio sp.]